MLQGKSPKEEFRPVYFDSKSPMEQRYSIIEKEAGAIVFACLKFDQFLFGMDNLKIETDQRPLVTLLGEKSLDNLLPRITRFRLVLMRYKFDISHIPDKENYTSDSLSRASISDYASSNLEQELSNFNEALLTNLPASDITPRADKTTTKG